MSESKKKVIDIPAGDEAQAWSMRYVVERAAAAATDSGGGLSGLAEDAEMFRMVAENAITGKKPLRVEKTSRDWRIVRVGKGSPKAGRKSKATVTMPEADYEALMDRLDALEGAQIIESRKDELAVPTAVARRIVAGESPVRVYREFRGLTQTAMAKKSGVTQSYVAAIEAGKKPGSATALKAIAEVLGVPMDVLVADD